VIVGAVCACDEDVVPSGRAGTEDFDKDVAESANGVAERGAEVAGADCDEDVVLTGGVGMELFVKDVVESAPVASWSAARRTRGPNATRSSCGRAGLARRTSSRTAPRRTAARWPTP